MGTTNSSSLEKVPRSVGCVAARRFACSPTDRTAQSFHCGHSVGITRCGGVRKSRSPDEDGLVVVWWLRTSGPSSFRVALLLDWRSTISAWFFCRSAGTRVPQRRGSLAAVTSTRPAVGVPVVWPSWCATPCRASACSPWHQLRGDHRLPRVPVCLLQHVRGGPLQTSTGIAHAAHFASNIRRLGPAAVICDMNPHHELRDGRSTSMTAGEDLAATSTGMDAELSDDPAQATWTSGRSVSFPDVTAQRVLRVSHWTSTRLHGLGPPSAIPHRGDGGRHPVTGRHAATTETFHRCPA
ncbi:trans-sialidase [Trypanosoma cruzi]|nr:trans-sialidase [Trypanosoma cruzi]